MARWEDAHDALLDAYQFHNSELGRGMIARGWVEMNAALMPDPAGFRRMYGDLPEVLPAALFNADLVYVDPDMMTLVEAAGSTFNPEPIVETDLPTNNGFMYLPRAVTTRWQDGSITSWRAALWARNPGGRGLFLALFSEDDPDNERAPQLRHRLLFDHCNTWPLFDPTMRVPDADDGPWFDDIKWMQVVWRLMAQTIAVTTARDVGGQFKGRAQRARFEPRRVTVVTLRRPDRGRDDDHEPRSVEWSRQWVVGGHWRSQWYPSLGLHRQIWISPYVKGPDDKPLVTPKLRVFNLAR